MSYSINKNTTPKEMDEITAKAAKKTKRANTNWKQFCGAVRFQGNPVEVIREMRDNE